MASKCDAQMLHLIGFAPDTELDNFMNFIEIKLDYINENDRCPTSCYLMLKSSTSGARALNLP